MEKLDLWPLYKVIYSLYSNAMIKHTKQVLILENHFLQVELSKLKRKLWDENRLKRMLKDIYFPYIQVDFADQLICV